MFEITSTQAIKITRGDTAIVTLVVDNGTSMQPYPHEFEPDASELLPYGTYVEFYLVDVNADPLEYPLLKKTFYTTGKIETAYCNHAPESEQGTTLDADGNFIITLSSDNTTFITGGEYRYLFRLVYSSNGSIHQSTISNKLPFYNVDDDFSGRKWNINSNDCITCYYNI